MGAGGCLWKGQVHRVTWGLRGTGSGRQEVRRSCFAGFPNFPYNDLWCGYNVSFFKLGASQHIKGRRLTSHLQAPPALEFGDCPGDIPATEQGQAGAGRDNCLYHITSIPGAAGPQEGRAFVPCSAHDPPHLSQHQRREETVPIRAAASLLGHRWVTCQLLPEPEAANKPIYRGCSGSWLPGPKDGQHMVRASLPGDTLPGPLGSPHFRALCPGGRTLGDSVCWARIKPIPKATLLGSFFTYSSLVPGTRWGQWGQQRPTCAGRGCDAVGQADVKCTKTPLTPMSAGRWHSEGQAGRPCLRRGQREPMPTAAIHHRHLPQFPGVWGGSVGFSSVPEGTGPPTGVTQLAGSRSWGRGTVLPRLCPLVAGWTAQPLQRPRHLLLITQKRSGQCHSQKQNQPSPSG